MKWYGKTSLAGIAMAGLLAAQTLAAAPQTTQKPAPQTWTGQISDAMCSGKHDGNAKDCVQKCIKDGEKYVLVVDKKVYAISNQTFADLPKFAGDTAVVTGDLKDADTITISKMAAPKKTK